jgi:fructose/tagatose bisphosphate aldolase
MILLFPWAVHYADGILVHAAAEAARNASVPVTVHMDHAQTPEIIRRAADLGGFDSIMVDMSHYEKAENLALTRELVEYCHARGIATEAEPGRIEGGEDGVADTADLEGLLTTPEESQEMCMASMGRVVFSWSMRGCSRSMRLLGGRCALCCMARTRLRRRFSRSALSVVCRRSISTRC